ncbi:MAG: PilW family protein [Burkholderiales bacterium]|jgi:prepilin-type N-terminal cleavage/methylation domain-containing protein|nr:PilW family protein [Burkholderiales bacterium]
MTIHNQQGRTLIELMVVIAISLIITLAVALIFLSVNRTSRYSSELSNVEDTGRVAMFFIGNAIRQAGYAEIVGSERTIAELGANTRANTLLADDLHLAGCTASSGITQTGADAPACIVGAAGFDALMVSYQGNNVIGPNQTNVTDCLGNNPVARNLPNGHVGQNVTLNRPVVQNFYFVNGNNLMCRAGTADAQTLIPNVQQFRVYFGFDQTRFDAPSPMRVGPSGNEELVPSAAQTYVDANFLNDPALDRTRLWDHVVSVYICLVVRSAPGLSPAAGVAAAQYSGCPDEAADVNAALPPVNNADGGVYRTYTQIFTVRSRATPNPTTFEPI